MRVLVSVLGNWIRLVWYDGVLHSGISIYSKYNYMDASNQATEKPTYQIHLESTRAGMEDDTR